MTDNRSELRGFTRVEMDLPVDIHQGGSVWKQRLINICLPGVATDQPDVWDAQYNEPFTLMVHLESGNTLELHAYLQHVASGRLGFSVQHVDDANIEPLRKLLADRIEDIAQLEEELRRLEY